MAKVKSFVQVTGRGENPNYGVLSVSIQMDPATKCSVHCLSQPANPLLQHSILFPLLPNFLGGFSHTTVYEHSISTKYSPYSLGVLHSLLPVGLGCFLFCFVLLQIFGFPLGYCLGYINNSNHIPNPGNKRDDRLPDLI